MKTHVVQPGETPASIAILYAGCPKCARDLMGIANPHKPTVTYKNGYVTFKDLRVNEEIKLPEKWFSKEFDELPPEYFAALPHPDGVTMPKRQSGVLGDYAAPEKGVTTGAIVGMSLVGAGLVGGAIYLTTRRKRRRR